uniref:UrcA family protein n=1 Tax=Parerythrobacter lutipelagi TaxID=1964208 RepID=UPI001375D832|nr:UrcA family protein [Parerythrobacter lutipelagi]
MTKSLTAAAIALAAIALPVSAAQANEGATVQVSYADLDLSGKAGQDIFDRRIERAIEKVCGNLTGRPTFDSSIRNCQLETRAAAKPSRDLAVANYGNARLARSDRQIRFAVK